MSEERKVWTRDEVIAEEAALRALPFTSEDARLTHERHAHLLPTTFPTRNPAGHLVSCGTGEDGACHCSWTFERGGLYASWHGGDEQDSRRFVVRVLGQIENDQGGGDWVVARIVASDVHAGVGQMLHFAPSSIIAGTFVPCQVPA